MAVRVVVVDNHDSYTYNLLHLVWEVSGRQPTVVRNDETTAGELLAAGFTHVVISPGPGSPDRPADVGLCGELVRRVEVPCLGVCLGHQAIAHGFGGRVGPAPVVMHGRRSAVRHDGRGLFAGIPQGFRAVRYHSLAVRAPLPPDLAVTAWTDDGVVAGLAHRTRPLWGVQFHPESVETEYGDRLVANFLGLPPGGRRRIVDLAPGRPARRTAAGVRVRWREVTPRASAADLFVGLFGDEEYAFWLDSARTGPGMGRYSVMGALDDSNRLVVRAWAGGRLVREETPGGASPYPGTILGYLAERMPSAAPGEGPVPFVGGFVGYLGYGVKESLGVGAPRDRNRDDADGQPDAELARADRLLALDHRTGRAFLVAAGPAEDSAPDAWLDTMEARVRGVAPGRAAALATAELPAPADLGASVDRDTYRAHLGEVARWLAAGDSYEACYTYQLRLTSDADPLSVYLRLRQANPAPYSAYLRFGDRRVLSSSPERFLTVTGDRWAETKPIKGTAPRSADPDEDARVRLALAADPKTRSENLMVADLLRNDLGRVCDPGTVHVPSLMAVESYATVHQLVTTVRGRLRPQAGPVDCLAALFPGGSMTGAPKRRTVELLDALEPAGRGVYSGCLGYFGYDGRADLSIVIRTMVWSGRRVSIGVGGAITVLSDVDAEYEETRLKAAALLAALGAAGLDHVPAGEPAAGPCRAPSRGVGS